MSKRKKMPRGRRAGAADDFSEVEVPDGLIQNAKLVFKLKPFPVHGLLNKQVFNYHKEAKVEMKCAICMDEIKSHKEFRLWSCAHFLCSECEFNLNTTRCPQCNL